ncbi:hypothetical protein Pdw03_8287 [Penicillium digitatum]|uniref:Thioesterase domain-containing protein n=1 Tax=Penicillium digitatum TaxID=36651 RepID=A0A7T7BLP7_PENDI|nr:hypothetical protein Pdw03_8287 [Penicillium digitatum]
MVQYRSILQSTLRQSSIQTRNFWRPVVRNVSTAAQPNASREPSRWMRRLIYAGVFGTLGVGAGKWLDNKIGVPPAPGTLEDQMELQEIQRVFDIGLPIVQELRSNPDYVENHVYENFTDKHKTHRLTSGPLAGSRGLGLQKVFWNDKEKKLVSVVFLGPGLEGWPTMVHGGALGTVIDENMGRAAIRHFPARTGVTASLELNYRAPVHSDNFYALHTTLDQKRSTETKAYAKYTQAEYDWGIFLNYGNILNYFLHRPAGPFGRSQLKNRKLAKEKQIPFGFYCRFDKVMIQYSVLVTKIFTETDTVGMAIAGADFCRVKFWPAESFNVYGHDPVDVGVCSPTIGFGITAENPELIELIVVPSSMITTVNCPDLGPDCHCLRSHTLSIRVVGGDNSYTIYYNFFISNFVTAATCFIDLTKELNIADVKLIGEAIELRGASLLGELRTIPCITNIETAYQMVVGASQLADAEDENGCMTDHVAVAV